MMLQFAWLLFLVINITCMSFKTFQFKTIPQLDRRLSSVLNTIPNSSQDVSNGSVNGKRSSTPNKSAKAAELIKELDKVSKLQLSELIEELYRLNVKFNLKSDIRELQVVLANHNLQQKSTFSAVSDSIKDNSESKNTEIFPDRGSSSRLNGIFFTDSEKLAGQIVSTGGKTTAKRSNEILKYLDRFNTFDEHYNYLMNDAALTREDYADLAKSLKLYIPSGASEQTVVSLIADAVMIKKRIFEVENNVSSEKSQPFIPRNTRSAKKSPLVSEAMDSVNLMSDIAETVWNSTFVGLSSIWSEYVVKLKLDRVQFDPAATIFKSCYYSFYNFIDVLATWAGNKIIPKQHVLVIACSFCIILRRGVRDFVLSLLAARIFTSFIVSIERKKEVTSGL